MPYDSPFGTRRIINPPLKDENSLRFARLKPICVELLGRITSYNSSSTSVEATHVLLRKLNSTLVEFSSASSSDYIPLSPSLINYVFFPLAQFLRANPKGEADLPDRIRQVIFEILSHLANDWWQVWTKLTESNVEGDSSKRKEQWKVWEQLLILGAVALGGPPDGQKNAKRTCSEETQVAICDFLLALLLPRLAAPFESLAAPEPEWEWDGEEELPSLDDFEHFQKEEKEFKKPIHNKAAGEYIQLYPSSSHLEHNYNTAACRGAIGHALSASLDVASDTNTSSTVKVSSLKIARLLIVCWMAGSCTITGQPNSLWREVKAEGAKVQRHQEDSSILFNPTAQADRVVVFLPGFVSSIIRILTSTPKKLKAETITQALFSLDCVLNVCLCDAAIADLVSSSGHGEEFKKAHPATSIEELVARTGFHENLNSLQVAAKDDKAKEESMTEGKAEPKGRNKAWLESTVSHIIIGLHSLDSLASHDHAHVQRGMLKLAHNLLTECYFMLSIQKTALAQVIEDGQESIDATRLLLRWIFDVAASDSSTKIAKTQAEVSILNLLSPDSKGRLAYHEAIKEEMLSLVTSFPNLLGSERDDEVKRVAARLTFLIHLSSPGLVSSTADLDGLHTFLATSGGVERWGPMLLWSLKVDDKMSMEHGLDAILLHNLSSATSKAVMEIFAELGRASANIIQRECQMGLETNSPFHMLWYFIDQATSHRSTRMTRSSSVYHSRLFCQNALIVVDGIVKGVAEILDDEKLALETSKSGKKLRRIAHRLAKEIIRRVTELWEEDEEELLQVDPSLQKRLGFSNEEKKVISQHNQGISAVEYTRGLGSSNEESNTFKRPSGFGPALQLDFVSSASLNGKGMTRASVKSDQHMQMIAKTQLDRSDGLLLSILSSTCKILGPSLKPLLLRMLYPIICGVASHSPLIREAAAEAMDEMARSAGYASVQGCVYDHADYVLGTASHRLISTLGQELQAISLRETEDSNTSTHIPLVSAQSAPLVLIEIIRMLGGEALTLIQDAIDEVLDAIDRYHLQPVICDNLLNVLDRLVEVMVSDERVKAQEEKDSPSKVVNSTTLSFQPNLEKDMEELQNWYRKRSQLSNDDQPNHSDQPFDETNGESQEAKDESQKPTSSQVVIVSILEKAVPFLSHASARIRIRCLRLLNRGIELLCLQNRTVEPLQIVNSAWPTIMSRLGFSLSISLRRFERLDVPAYEDLSERDFHTCTEAAKLVTTLARFLVDFLGSEKMLRQAVPRLLLLLKIVERGEGRGGGVEGKPGSLQKTFLLKNDVATNTQLTPSSTRLPPRFQSIQPFTPLYSMVLTVFSTLDTLIKAMGPQITDTDLYQFATHPTLLCCLDRRQEAELQSVASQFYRSTLSNRNENLVWLVLGGAADEQDYFPAFLHRQQLVLE